jgi:hypothetical protein
MEEAGLVTTDDQETQAALMAALLKRLPADPKLGLGTMFRSPAISWRGNIVAFAGRRRRLIVKLTQGRAAELIDAGHAEPVTMGRRTMREWVAVPAQGVGEEALDAWLPFVAEGVANARPS